MTKRRNPYDPIVDLYQPARKRARNYLGYAREARAKGSPEAAFLLRVAKAHKKSAADIRKSPFHKWAWPKKNPFRALRVKGGNTWFAQSQAAAALSLRAAGGRGASTSHRRYVLGQARDLRRLAYHTPKAKKNPFRKLRAGADPFLLSHAAAYRTAAEAHRLRPTYRRHELLWARTLRKKAYYTPKRRKKA